MRENQPKVIIFSITFLNSENIVQLKYPLLRISDFLKQLQVKIEKRSTLKKAFVLENFDVDKEMNDADMELLKRELCLDDSGKYWWLSNEVQFISSTENFYAKC